MPERRLPRANAFAARGVTLKYPDRGWSGISARESVSLRAPGLERFFPQYAQEARWAALPG
jgi:hypothetical protein